MNFHQMRTQPLHFTLNASLKVLKFFWENKPNVKEAFLYSSIQSFFEIKLGTDSKLSDNPTARAVIRDLAKFFGEWSLYFKKEHYGTTDFWHDEFSMFSAIQKPLLKIATIFGYKSYYDSSIDAQLEHWKETIEKQNNIVIPEKIKVALEQYLTADVLSKASRLSNFVGEPFARLVDGCSKTHQKGLVQDFKESNPDVESIISNDAFSQFKVENNIGILGVFPHVIKNGFSLIPFAANYAVMKAAGIDYLGEIYKGLGIKTHFVEARHWIDEKFLEYYNDSYIAEKIPTSDENIENAWSFITELTEKTLHNMVAMVFFSTPNKVIGNTLHFLDGLYPNLVRPLGIALGTHYVYKNFFDYEHQSTPFSKFLRKAKVELNEEEQCYANFIEVILNNEDGLPTEAHDYHPFVTELNTCLGSINSSDELQEIAEL